MKKVAQAVVEGKLGVLDSNNQMVDLKVGYSAMNHKLDLVFWCSS